MFHYFYALGFSMALVGLILWFYFRKSSQWNRIMRLLFFIGIAVYGVGIFLSPGMLAYKLLILSRDGFIIAILAWFFNAIKHQYMIFYVMLILLAGGLWYGFEHLQQTFTYADTSKGSVPLEPTGEILIDVREGRRSALVTLLQSRNLYPQSAFQMKFPGETELDDYVVIDIPDDKQHLISELKTQLNERGLVDWFEVNEQVQLSPLPSRPYEPSESEGPHPVNDPMFPDQWYLDAIGYESFLETHPKPVEQSLLAILDTGIDGEHEDLKDHLKPGKSSDYTDKAGHGTHCGGIAGAVTNNGTGIASLNIEGAFFDVLSIKVLNDRGVGSQQSIIQGILRAADRGARVISFSLGGRSNHRRQKAYKAAVEYANKRGAIVVAAAGNASSNASGYVPASVEGVICVSAIDSLDQIASFSNHVTDIEWGLAAPGTEIISTIPDNQYRMFNGTSMATPMVASTIGIMKSLRPNMNTRDAWSLLHRTGNTTKSGEQSGRLIQINALFETMQNELNQ